jgi:hypothetical protein
MRAPASGKGGRRSSSTVGVEPGQPPFLRFG